jgi:hypothetical protein
MKKPLALIVPTRSRPDNAERLFCAALAESAFLLHDDIYFVVGKEDPKLSRYLDTDYDIGYLNRIKVFPDRGLVKALNWMAPQLTSKYECLAFMGDDHLPRTEGWDAKYVNELWRLGDGFVYGDDLLQGEKIPTQVAMTSSIVETLGFFTPPGFTHLCCDLAWKDLGEGIDKITYMPEVVIEHLHPAAGKAEIDEGYRFVNSEEMVEKDTAEYFRWKAEDLPGQIAQLKNGLRSLAERATV